MSKEKSTGQRAFEDLCAKAQEEVAAEAHAASTWCDGVLWARDQLAEWQAMQTQALTPATSMPSAGWHCREGIRMSDTTDRLEELPAIKISEVRDLVFEYQRMEQQLAVAHDALRLIKDRASYGVGCADEWLISECNHGLQGGEKDELPNTEG